jgi:beta-lactamase class D
MKRFLVFLLLAFVAGCSPNNVDVDDSLGDFFKKENVTGCFALLNNNTGGFTIYNLDRYKDSAYLPASTFKIVNSLVGLQTGVIANDSMVIRWDSVTRPVAAWNKDLSYYEAFRVSAVPYFQEVARRIGKDTMQFWLDSLHYGSAKITTHIDTFWLDNSLKITPDEELGLVKKLYFNQLPFYRINQEIVKRAMLMEDKPEYKLSYKTGWSGWDEKTNRQIAWMVGYVEENNHPYFFVLNFESKDRNQDIPAIRSRIVKGILSQLGFLKGQK